MRLAQTEKPKSRLECICALLAKCGFSFFLNGGSKLLRMIFAFYLANAGKFAGGNFIIMVKWKCYILWKCIIMSVIKMSLNDTCACPLHSRNHLHGIFWQQQFPRKIQIKPPLPLWISQHCHSPLLIFVDSSNLHFIFNSVAAPTQLPTYIYT